MSIKIEYLLPVLASGPQLLKFLVWVWLILTIVVWAWILKINYAKNMESIILKEARPYVVINRILEDTENFLKSAEEKHSKAIDQKAGEYNSRGVLHSGGYIKAQYELVQLNQRAIESYWQEAERKIQDQLLEIGSKDIRDVDTKERYEVTKNKKAFTVDKIMNKTDGWFERRAASFKPLDVKNIKESTFNNTH